jgi:hypothetical protein
MAEITLRGTRPMLDVRIDTELHELPLTFNAREVEAFGKAADKTVAMHDFYRAYLGEAFDRLGDDELLALDNIFVAERKRIGEPDMGESSASPTS